MGCTSSTYICQRVTFALAHIHNSWGALCTNYLDDFVGVAPPEKAEKDCCKLSWLLQDKGICEPEHKACPPSSIMVVLGILFNTIDMTLSISPDRVDEIQAELEAWCNRAKMSHKQPSTLTDMGVGSVCKGYYFHTPFQDFIVQQAHIIAHLELLAFIVAHKAWPHLVPGMPQ